MGWKCLAWLWVTLAVALCGFATPAAARDIPLEPYLCVGGAASASEAFDLPAEELDCSASRFDNYSQYVRSSADIPAILDGNEGGLVWQTDPSSFDAMLLRFIYANGETRLVDIDPQMAARNWFVRSRFSVPVPKVEAGLVAVDAVVQRPRTNATLRDARLVSASEARHLQSTRSLLYALVCGLLIAPIVFDVFFLRLLRSRFMLWHVGMTFWFLGLVYFYSGLVFISFPDLPLEARYQLNTLTLVLGIACTVMFVLDILEAGMVSASMRKALGLLVALMLAVKLATMFDVESWRMRSHSLLLASILPVGAAILAIVFRALHRKSRTAVFLLIAVLPVVVGGLLRILWSLTSLPIPSLVSDLTFVGLAVLVLGTSAAVGDRFMVLRVERDRARMNAIKMQRMAHSDALTGVGNRRAFEGVGDLAADEALLMADIDHFKAINDTKGHAIGDAVLVDTANRLKRVFARDDSARLFRLGGEEFGIIFRCASSSELRDAGEAIRREMQSAKRRREDDLPGITISVGGALGRGRSIQQAFAEADAALYRAKKAGRNKVVISGQA